MAVREQGPRVRWEGEVRSVLDMDEAQAYRDKLLVQLGEYGAYTTFELTSSSLRIVVDLPHVSLKLDAHFHHVVRTLPKDIEWRRDGYSLL